MEVILAAPEHAELIKKFSEHAGVQTKGSHKQFAARLSEENSFVHILISRGRMVGVSHSSYDPEKKEYTFHNVLVKRAGSKERRLAELLSAAKEHAFSHTGADLFLAEPGELQKDTYCKAGMNLADLPSATGRKAAITRTDHLKMKANH